MPLSKKEIEALGDDRLEVIPKSEIDDDLNEIKSDVSDLRTQMASDSEATKLAIEERGDDLVKALEAVESITSRMDDLTKKIQTNEFAATFGDTSGELKDALDSFCIGFEEFNRKDAEKHAVEMDIGTKPSIKHLIEGVFFKASDDPDDEERTFHAPRHKAIRRLQKASDDCYIVDAMMRSQMDPNELEAYRLAGGIRSLKTYAKYEHIATGFVKAAGELIDTGTEVANWLPTQYSANLYEQVKIGLPLLTLFQEIAMNAPTMVLPLDMNDHEAMRTTEVTTTTAADPYADTDFMNPGALASGSITAVAEKIRARYWITRDAEEDAIVAMLPFLNRKGRRGMGEAIEDAIVNGDDNAAGASLDTAGTHFGKANSAPYAATDSRRCWDGLRLMFSTYAGSPATRVDNSNGKATVIGLRALRGAMGEYGIDPGNVAYLAGIFGYIKLLDDTTVLTVDKFGPQATVRTGTLAQVDGADVLVSRRIPQNLNAAGIIDNITVNRTLVQAVNVESALLFNRRRITVGQQAHVASDSQEIVWHWRGDFQSVYAPATVPFGGELYNVAAA